MTRQYRYDDPCAECPLEKRAMPTLGKKSAKILVVAKSPSGWMISKRKHIGNRHGTKVFERAMFEANFKRSDFVYHSEVRCQFPRKEMVAADRRKVEKACREWLLRAIEKMRPDIIVPLGADAAKQVMNRAVAITKQRGKLIRNEAFGVWVFPMLDPDYCSMYPQNIPLMDADARKLRQLMDNGFDEEAVARDTAGEYTIISDLQFLIDKRPEVLAFDVETMSGLHWYQANNGIAMMQFCCEEGIAYALPWDHPEDKKSARQKRRLKRQLKALLLNPETSVIGHNLKFDAVMVDAHVGFRMKIGGDTLMLTALIDENSMDKSLATQVKHYVPEMAGYSDWFDSTFPKDSLKDAPLDKLVDYGCGDVDACLRLHAVLEPTVRKDKKLWNHYRRCSLPGLNAFVAIERRGMLIDTEQLNRFEQHMEKEVENQRKSLLRRVPKSIKREHVQAGKALKFSRTELIADILFTHPDGFRLKPKVFTDATAQLPDHLKKPSTSSKNHLPYFFDHKKHGQFVIDLAQHIKDSSLLEKNIKGFRTKFMHGRKIYPTYSLSVAVTGRTSSQDPNAQNFPKRGKNAKEYRKQFVAPPGWLMLAADLSQAELRISANMARDPVMLEIYRVGGDIHKATACIVMGKTEREFDALPEDEKDLARFKAKAVNFGFIYGMGWRNFIVYSKTQYGVEFTEKQAQRIRYAFFGKYYGLPEWHRKMREFVRRHHYVRSYSGRIRHLPMIESHEEYIRNEAERQAINSPVQEFASTLGVMAVAEVDRRVSPEYLQTIGFVHDAIYAYVKAEYLEWGAKMLKHAMESIPIEKWFGVKMHVPIIADVSFGTNAGEMFELKGLRTGSKSQYDFNPILQDASKKQVNIKLPRQRVPLDAGLIRRAA